MRRSRRLRLQGAFHWQRMRGRLASAKAAERQGFCVMPVPLSWAASAGNAGDLPLTGDGGGEPKRESSSSSNMLQLKKAVLWVYRWILDNSR